MNTYTFDVIRTEYISKQKYYEPVTFSFNEILAYLPHFEGSLILVEKDQKMFELVVKEAYAQLNKDLGIIDKFKKVKIT